MHSYHTITGRDYDYLRPASLACVVIWSILGLLLVAAVCVVWSSPTLRGATRTLYVVSDLVERESPSVRDGIETARAVLNALNKSDTVGRVSLLLDSFLTSPFGD